MKRTWKNFYQMWIKYKDAEETTECVFSTPSPPHAEEYARKASTIYARRNDCAVVPFARRHRLSDPIKGEMARG